MVNVEKRQSAARLSAGGQPVAKNFKEKHIVRMQVTKFGHSCLLVEEGDARVLIDPGMWSEGHTDVVNLDAVFITHEHPDHCDIPSLQALKEKNPKAVIYTNAGVGKKLSDAGLPYERCEDGQSVVIRGLAVEARGKDHAEIYSTFPHVDNTGFFIGRRLFHPGDAVNVTPTAPVEILALPVVAPWMRLAQALDYALSLRPKKVFPIHDGMLKHTGPFHAIPKSILSTAGIKVILPEHGKAMTFS